MNDEFNEKECLEELMEINLRVARLNQEETRIRHALTEELLVSVKLVSRLNILRREREEKERRRKS